MQNLYYFNFRRSISPSAEGGVVVRKLGPKYLAGLDIFSLFRRLNLTLLFDLGVCGVLSMDFVLGVLGVCIWGVVGVGIVLGMWIE